MRPPPKTPNTLYALEATEYAQQQGKFLEFHRAAYRALWEDGRDLGELIKSLEGQQYSTTVMEQYQEALKHGINGIPTFLVGNLLFTGAHPYNIFQAAMQRVLQAE
jgi:predicted DsbA family dithiol-disulfide isomerase